MYVGSRAHIHTRNLYYILICPVIKLHRRTVCIRMNIIFSVAVSESHMPVYSYYTMETRTLMSVTINVVTDSIIVLCCVCFFKHTHTRTRTQT